MNGFKILCTLITLLCVAIIGAASIIGNAAWYVWVMSLGLIGYITCTDWPKGRQNAHECHVQCAFICNLNTCIVSWVVIWLELWPHLLVGLTAVLWASSAFWVCCAHLGEKKGKFFWWLGLSVASFCTIGYSLIIFSENLGHAVSRYVSGGLILFTLGIFFLTLIIGFILYVWPPIKEIIAGIKEICRIVKNAPRNND